MKQVSRRDAVLMEYVVYARSQVSDATFRHAQGSRGGDRQVHRRQELAEGKISIELPEIAENGNTMPLDHHGRCANEVPKYVSDVLVVAEANPNPATSNISFHAVVGSRGGRHPYPAGGDREQNNRGRQDQRRAVLHRAKAVKVTIGGCGG